jgi:hypothetical protein
MNEPLSIMVIPEPLIRRDYWRAYCYTEIKQQLQAIAPTGDGVEFGGSEGSIQSMCPGVAWENRDYPGYDIQDPVSFERQWDWLVADNILEHIDRPWEAAKLIGEHATNAIITVPFLIGVHNCPSDYFRMTPAALHSMFDPYYDEIDIRSWGNSLANYYHSFYIMTDQLLGAVPEEEWRAALYANDPAHPFLIWAIMRRSR